MTLSAGTRLGSYEVLSPLGSGGMGEVYRARDSKLRRDVAIKVLPQSLAADPAALSRFEREAFAVAALSHPNILAIFDFGTQEGTAYAVMELLEGETLRGKLDAGPIGQGRAVDYALQIAKGLAAAHEKGIVHRDLKPENLFISKDGHLKILDFGLAKKVESATPGEETSAPTGSGHTEPGTVMGTMGYMSPEQVRGQPVDHRSDLFSFGAVLYEMLSGRKAFKRDTPSDTIAAILKEDPPELMQSGPMALHPIVKHCLEKDRDNRFQSVRDVAFALSEASSPSSASGGQYGPPKAGTWKVPALIAATVVLIAVCAFLVRRTHGRVSREIPVTRVAVLPFENLGAPEDEYFADGIADEVRGKLTALPGLQVIARGSSTPYKKTTKSPKQIATELNASYLLTATVRWERRGGASRVHLNPELVDVTSRDAPTARWQEPFDATITNVFEVQSDIATRVAQALVGALSAQEQRQLIEKPTENLAAYDAFLKGEAIANTGAQDPTGVRKALGFYEQAIALDPGFAKAWARVSWASAHLYGSSGPTPALAERARQAAEKVVSLAPGRPEGYLALGTYERAVASDLKRALEQYERGLRVAPGDVQLLRGSAIAAQGLGHWDAAVERLKQAERLDPRSAVSPGLADALLRLRRYPEARLALDRGLAIAPANIFLIHLKVMSFLGEGDLRGARAMLRAAPKEIEPTALVAFLSTYNDLLWVLDADQRDVLLRLSPDAFDGNRGYWANCLAQACALKGDSAKLRAYAEQARQVFEEQLHSTPDDPLSHMLLGLALAYLGRHAEAVLEGENGVSRDPIAKNGMEGPYYQHQLVRIYMLVGEPEKALDRLEPLLKVPYYLSPGWLAIDPNFDPLRNNPRFKKLVAVAK